jgi:tetratricopeptide (TPR) repeat protein
LYKAEADLLLAADRAPFDPSAWLRLARLYQIWGVLDRAEAACARALLVGPYRAAVWDTCASISAQRGEADQAAARRERAQALSSPL